MVMFFFSSRRRHTRWPRDWSSDVCSSDLLTGGKSSDRDTDVRAALEPLNALADLLDCILAGVRHITNKKIDGDAVAAVLGSSDWVNVPRCVIAITNDPEDEDVRHLHVVAGNRAKNGDGRKF